jgi:predicted membrane protein
MKRHDIFWGMIFILAAVLIIFNQFGLFIGVSMFELLATILLVVIIIKSLRHFNFWGILFPLAFICILYADEWNITRFTPWPALFTALLLSIGFSILFRQNHVWWGYSGHHHNSFSSNVVNEMDDNIVNCSTAFGECMKYVNSQNFERANISCSFGEIKVFFDNAAIPSGKADIYLNVSFGSAKLYIPKSWKVVCKANVFLGEMNEHGNPGSDTPVVTIHGSVSFGDAKVIYV